MTIRDVFAAYRQQRMPDMKPARVREAESRIAMFEDAWGRGLLVADVNQTRVNMYCRKRRELAVVSPGLQVNEDGHGRRGYRSPKPVRDGALDAEFRWLTSVFNWAHGFKVGGKRMIPENPLRGTEWPREQNPRRPVASQQRYLATLEHVDAKDPAGRLRCILALARHTGRRESAICSIAASDLLLSIDRIREALAAAGMDEGMADHMPHSAIRWAAETDKQGLLFISPVNRHARVAIDAYLRKNPRMGGVPLFPAPRKPVKSKSDVEHPIRRETAGKWRWWRRRRWPSCPSWLAEFSTRTAACGRPSESICPTSMLRPPAAGKTPKRSS
ncbi:MAG: hypothetical protein ACRERX_23525 [Pseudomonas sp.]